MTNNPDYPVLIWIVKKTTDHKYHKMFISNSNTKAAINHKENFIQ